MAELKTVLPAPAEVSSEAGGMLSIVCAGLVEISNSLQVGPRDGLWSDQAYNVWRVSHQSKML